MTEPCPQWEMDLDDDTSEADLDRPVPYKQVHTERTEDDNGEK